MGFGWQECCLVARCGWLSLVRTGRRAGFCSEDRGCMAFGWAGTCTLSGGSSKEGMGPCSLNFDT
jgi:hypothetical protein